MFNCRTGWSIGVALLLVGSIARAQSDGCPVNLDFSMRDLTNWSATTGLVGGATQSYPRPNNGLAAIPEFSLSTTGVRIITSSFSDRFGSFPTIPNINGYQYSYSVQLGSTATSHDLNGTDRTPGGFTRAITYTIEVPPGSSTEPYTISYAYALVLENGTHNSNEQPLFKATLKTADSVISCASPQYYLPTLNDAQGGPGQGGASRGATLDSATALANGFINSPELFLSYSGQNDNNGTMLQDVWTKKWTEVTVDLAAYRGQEVTLSFEADNCEPGAHFAYAYVALRNTCAGPQITGLNTACSNTQVTYTIPGLPQASYYWTVPDGWTIISGGNSNTIITKSGINGGTISVRQVNGCADLKDTLMVNTSPPTIAGQAGDDQTVCAGINDIVLSVTGNSGSLLDWLSSTDGINWTSLGISGNPYHVNNLIATTQFAALVQNGDACSIDTSAAALITVDPLSDGGMLLPANTDICREQNVIPVLTLTNNTGKTVNWEQSADSISWAPFSPAYQQAVYSPGNLAANNYYRVAVKSGVCPGDTSTVAAIRLYDVLFPEAVLNPDLLSVCYGQPVQLTATINSGNNYTWTTATVPTPENSGVIYGLPQVISITFTPPATSDAVLTVYNNGCPNPLHDTVHIIVAPPVIVSAGNDTTAVIGQSLQLHALALSDGVSQFFWSPATGLNNAFTDGPIAIYNNSDPAYITYTVKASTAAGCSGSDTMTVRIFKTLSDIFVPNAFTPNNDGRNDILRPVYAGIEKLQLFSIYNRWGQLVFSTTDMGRGWDGSFGGRLQSTGAYMYIIQGVDYNGRVINKKGSCTLIR